MATTHDSEDVTPSVREFYAGKTIFLTGGTGFVGKVLMEKLLRCCPEIGTIYCLVRAKKNQKAAERLRNVFNDKLYDMLREQRGPSFCDNVKAVQGDMLEDRLGVSDEDRQLLEDNVNIVFHSAATVRFDEQLRLALQMNVMGVRQMVQLCRRFKHLLVFVHTSTAYANCDRPYIEEKIYPPPMEPSKLLDAASWMTDDVMQAITPKLIEPMPNTYTYTKKMAESLLVHEGIDMPLAIVRPSIVTATWKEPLQGWVDNYNGPSGLYIATGKGFLRSMFGTSNCVADLTPIDLPVNVLISVAWYTAVMKPRQVLVYNVTTGGVNPFTWGEMEKQVVDCFKRNPLEDAIRRPHVQIIEKRWMHDLWVYTNHLMPAHVIDFVYKLLGRKPRMMPIYNKLHKAMSTLEFFTRNQWQWSHHNVDMLKRVMSDEDRQVFYVDPRGLHWPTYVENYCLGTKKYILKEDLSGLPAARAHLRKLRNMRYIFNTLLVVALWRVLIAKSTLAVNSWYFVLGLVFKFIKFFRITSSVSQS